MPWDDGSATATDEAPPANYFNLPDLPGLNDLAPSGGVPDAPASKYSPEVERMRPWAQSQSSSDADAETWLQGAQNELDQQQQQKARIADMTTSQGELDAQGPTHGSVTSPTGPDAANQARIASNAQADAEAAAEAGRHSNNPLSAAENASRIPKITDYIEQKVRPAAASAIDTGLNAAAAVAPALQSIPVIGPASLAARTAGQGGRQAAANVVASQIPATGLDIGLTAAPALGEAAGALREGVAGSETAQRVIGALGDETGSLRLPGGNSLPDAAWTSADGTVNQYPVADHMVQVDDRGGGILHVSTERTGAAVSAQGDPLGLDAFTQRSPGGSVGSLRQVGDFLDNLATSNPDKRILVDPTDARRSAAYQRFGFKPATGTTNGMLELDPEALRSVLRPGVPEPGTIDSAQRQLSWLKDNAKETDLSPEAKKLVGVLDPQTAALSMAKDPNFVAGDANAVKGWLENEAQRLKATPGEYGAPPPSHLVRDEHAPQVDTQTGEHILYHGTAGPLQGDQLQPDTFLTPHKETAQTIANLQSRLTGQDPNVVEVRSHPDATRPMDEAQSFAASQGARQVSDPNRVRVVNPEAPTPIRPDMEAPAAPAGPPRFTDNVLQQVQQQGGHSDADMAIVKDLGNDPIKAMQFSLENPAEAKRLVPILSDAVEAQRQSDNGLASGFMRDTAVVRNRASELSSRMEAGNGNSGISGSDTGAAGNPNDTKALPGNAAGENGPGGRAPLGEEPNGQSPAPASGVDPAALAEWARLSGQKPDALARFRRLNPGDATAATSTMEPQGLQGFEAQRNAVGSERGVPPGNVPPVAPPTPAGEPQPEGWRGAVAGVPSSLKNNILALNDLGRATATYGHVVFGRQGIFYAVSHPTIFGEAIKNFVSVVRNPEAADEIQAAINDAAQSAPGWKSSFIKSGDAPPDSFIRSLSAKLGITGNRVQQANYLYLDTLRKVGYAHTAQAMDAIGITDPLAYADEWKAMNTATGHGLAAGSVSGQANPFFSMSALVSRFKTFTDPFVLRGGILQPGARNDAIRNLLGLGAIVAGQKAIVTAAGGKLDWDVNTPLGKTELGLSRLDPTGGASSVVRLALHTGLDIYNNSGGGTAAPNLDQMRKDLTQTVGSFLRGQLGPTSDVAVSTLTGQDWQGKPYSIGQQAMSGALVKNFAPIAVQSIMDNVQANGPIGALYGLPSVAAVSVNPISASQNLQKAAADAGVPNWSGLLPVEQAAAVKAHPELQQAYDQYQQQRTSPTAVIEQAKYDKLAALAPLAASTNPQDRVQYRQKAGDAVSEAAIAYQQGVKDGSIKPFAGSQSPQQKALDGYYNAIAPARTATGVDYNKQDQLSADYLATLPSDVRGKVIDQLAYSPDPQYKQLLDARQNLKDYWNVPDQAFAQWKQQVASNAAPGSLASQASNYSNYSDFAAFIKQKAIAGAQAAEKAGQIPAGRADYEGTKAADKWLADNKLSGSGGIVDFMKAKAIYNDPSLMDDLREWYPDSVSKYLLDAEQQGKAKQN